MILRSIFVVCFCILFQAGNGASKIEKLQNPNLQSSGGDSSLHRHAMDKLEPDLAQSIFGSSNRNPLERTTAKPKIMVKSPTLRGKRDSLLDIKPADVKILGSENPAPESEATTSIDLIIDETLNLSAPEKDKVIDAEIAIVTSAPQERTTITSGITDVAAPTPKYNLTQNDNSPTENLDRKILAFEIDSHNRKIFEELQKKKALAFEEAAAREGEIQETEAPKLVAETTVLPTTSAVSAANEVQIDESKTLLNEVGFDGAAKIPAIPSAVGTTQKIDIVPEEAPPPESAPLRESATLPATPESTPIPAAPESASLPSAPESAQLPAASESAPLSTASESAPLPATPESAPLPAASESAPLTTASESAPLTAATELPENVTTIATSEIQETPEEKDLEVSIVEDPLPQPEIPTTLPEAAAPKPSTESPISEIANPAPESVAPELPAIPEALPESLTESQTESQSQQLADGDAITSHAQENLHHSALESEARAAKVNAPPPSEIPGFLIPNRPILDSSVQKRRHLISNYIDPLQAQKSNLLQQKQKFFRESTVNVAARERSRRDAKKPELPIAEYDDENDAIDEPDSSEKNIIVRLMKAEDEENATISASNEATTTATSDAGSAESKIQLKLISKKISSKKGILDNQVQKSTTIPDSTTEATVTQETDAENATTPKPSKESLISKAITREEKIAILESLNLRKGINLGKISSPKKPDSDPIDDSAESEDDQNPWSNRFKTHIQLKLTDESREVVERGQLKILPKLISPEVLRAQKKAEREAKRKAKAEEEFEFKDLPEAPHSGDLKVDSDVVKKPAKEVDSLKTSTVSPTSVAVNRDISHPAPPQLSRSFVAGPNFQQQPQQQFFQQPFQQSFQQPFQQPFQQQQLPSQGRIIIIGGVRYFLRNPTPQQQQFLQPPQQQLHQQPQNFGAPPSHQPVPSPSPTTQTPKPHRLIHDGNGKPPSTTPPPTTQSPKNRPPEELSLVRIFHHRGTTRQVVATTAAPTTRATSTEATTLPPTTQWVPVTFTTHPTPTPPFDAHLVTTPRPIAKSRVRTHIANFELYDEVETEATKKSSTPTDFDDSEVSVKKGASLRHPPNDPPPSSNVDYSDDDLSTRRKQPPKLIRLSNAAASSIPQKPTDFLGDVPIAKADLRGLDKRIATVSH